MQGDHITTREWRLGELRAKGFRKGSRSVVAGWSAPSQLRIQALAWRMVSFRDGTFRARRLRHAANQDMRRALSRHRLASSAVRTRRNGPRLYATQAAGNPALQVFDRHVKLLQKERAASNTNASRQTDYLKDEVAQRLCGRLLVTCSRRLSSATSTGSADEATRTSTGTSRTCSTWAQTPAILRAS